MEQTMNYFQQAMWVFVLLTTPPLLVATLCGFVVSLFQAITQIQDQTLPYVVKLIAVAIALAVLGRWIGVELIRLSDMAFSMVPTVGR